MYYNVLTMRRRRRRTIQRQFPDRYYKPRGIPLSQLQETSITDEELEALRLRYMKKLDQREAAEKMDISQSQYQRDLTSALEKLTTALVQGDAIRLVTAAEERRSQ
jgi:predicted DNA-binding protein (UPF0251 family)